MTKISESAAASAPLSAELPSADPKPALWRHKEFKRFSKFFVVGLIGAVIDNGTFNGLNALGLLNSVKLSLPLGFTLTGLGIAGAIGFILAIISNFIWNRVWIYPDSRSKSLLGQAISFFAISIIGIVIRIPILELLHGPLTALERLALPQLSMNTVVTLGENSAWAISVIAVMFWNFFVNRYVTYNDVQ